MSKDVLETAHDKAMKYKEEGNCFVKKQNWEKALECYTKAIKTYPYNGIFYANRGLCQLKLKNFQPAVTDCTAALRLDSTYVKAYFRRASARMGLQQYKEAKQDLEEVLALERSNKEAKLLVAEVQKNIETSKPVVNTKERTLGKATMDKRNDAQTCPSPKSDIKKGVKDEKSSDTESPLMKQQKRDPCIPDSLKAKDVPLENDTKISTVLKPPFVKISAQEIANAEKHQIANDQKVCKKEQPTVIPKAAKDNKYVSESFENVIANKEKCTDNKAANSLKQRIPEWSAGNNEISVVECPEKPEKAFLKISGQDVETSAKPSHKAGNENQPAEISETNFKNKENNCKYSESVGTPKSVKAEHEERDRLDIALDWIEDKDELSVVQSIKRPPNSTKKPLVKIPIKVLEHALKHYEDFDYKIDSEKQSTEKLEIVKDNTNDPVLSERVVPTKIADIKNYEAEEGDKNNEETSAEIIPLKQKLYPGIPEWLTQNNEISIVQSPERPSPARLKKADESIVEIKTAENRQIPKTAVQFLTEWKTNKLPEFRYKYLKQLPKGKLPDIFKDSMEPDTFNEILDTLQTEFIKMQDPVYEHLEDISQVNRFRALIMFVSNTQKRALRTLFEYCQTIENISKKEVDVLREKYEVL